MFGPPCAVLQRGSKMNTRLVNLGLPTGVAAKASPLSTATSGGTSGSFALELSALRPWNGNLDSDSDANASMNARNPQGGAGKKSSSTAASSLPSPLMMHGRLAQAEKCPSAPNGGAGRTSIFSVSAQSLAGGDLPPASSNYSAPEITASVRATGIAQVAFGERRVASAGSGASAQTTGISGSILLASPISNQIQPQVAPPAVFTGAVAGQQNWVIPSVDEEGALSLTGTKSSATKVEDGSTSPQIHRAANGLAVEQMPSIGPTDQRELSSQLQLQSAPGLVAGVLSNPSTALNLASRTQARVAYRQTADASPEVYQDASALVVAPLPTAGPTEQTEQSGQSRPQGASGLVASALSNPVPQLNLTGRTQAQMAYRQTADASPEVYQDASALVVAPLPTAGPTEQTEQSGQSQPQGASGLVASALSNPVPQLNLTGRTQAQMAYRQTADASPAPAGEPRNGEPGPAKLAAPADAAASLSGKPPSFRAMSESSSSSAQEVPQDARPSERRSVSQKQAAEPQVLVDPADHYLDEPDAELPVAGTLLQFLAVHPQVLWGGIADSDSQPSGKPDSTNSSPLEMSPNLPIPAATGQLVSLTAQGGSSLEQPQSANAGKLAREAEQNNNGKIALTQRASGTEVTSRGTGLSTEAAPPAVNPSNSARLRSPESDKSEDADHAGSQPSSKEGVPGPGNMAPVGVDGTQAGGDSNSSPAVTLQDAQGDSTTDRTPAPSKTVSSASAGQKVSPPNTDTSSQIAVDPSQAIRRGSDAQNEPEAPTTGPAGHAAPTLQDWDGVRESMGQQVSSAHLAEVMGRLEMQVDMKSDSWGPVSVHATLNNGLVGAEIQVSDRDAHATLTEGLQGLEKTLGDKGIQVMNLDVTKSLGYSNAQSQGQQENQAGRPYHAAKVYTHRVAVETETPAASTISNSTDDLVLRRVSVRV